MNITVAGTGYVGLSLAILLSKNHHVVAYDINQEKVDQLNKDVLPIHDSYAEDDIKKNGLLFVATTDMNEAFTKADYIIIATPTDYNDKANAFDTKSVDQVIADALKINKTASIVIKSTVPVGYTKKMNSQFKTDRILFSPEFLREGRALEDNLHPSRIIVGGEKSRAEAFGELLKLNAVKKEVPLIVSDSSEAEAVKLFSNTYLAMRIAFFNELDSYAERYDLNAAQIIEGIGYDERIGNYYNNPSFGYGGYCLPKDTKQLLSDFKEIPNQMIGAVVASNDIRKHHVVNQIIARKPKSVGIYRLTMKTGSDNFRQSAILDVIRLLKETDIELTIYEPLISSSDFEGIRVYHELDEFKSRADLIVTNRWDEQLLDVKEKVYTRDIYHID
ncbi:nucleotide sugar dehydrogenase [Jeotgalibacillus sp. R-1-5s-1]|uniref:nucleotide sugar dehydrogenase n=1 Tax=Jeotgalibacillus sp. R-1-5s-1 TaxID=2555897 RepID=UPI00106A9093|nr:nucleotide sugar dehydrogenase [Jeotgalibacillus sp. R-1-5s-1]TFD97099.1 nucleotide sugar dehydrogenase [Jeotgalibacillus sp. R-1-5s-1]